MMHLPNLIEDLGLILVSAAIVTLLFKKLHQPVVLGYLLVGFFVGPNFPFLPTVKDTTSIGIWAEIGVIFMLFGLGLEFSFKKLSKVGKSAGFTASFEILFMLGIGFLAGRMLGWSKMDSLFLGGILSISSTTIIVRAFDELGLKGRSFVSLVFGVLIVEDLIAILLLVLLSSVAATQSLSGSDLLYSSLRLGFFLVLWFLLGIYVLPIFLRYFKDLLSNETMLIVSIGLCLLMVIFASHVGFSPALGAFVMGSILAETPKGPKTEHLIHPVKDLFSAVFFVSVGMLIDLKVLQEHFGVIMLITALTIIGKIVSSASGAFLSGRSFKSSVQAGMSLAQIGEFSFIIATLGMTLKVTSDFLYPVAVAVSAITTFTTPYLVQCSEKTADWVEVRLPTWFKDALSSYEAAMSASSDGSLLSLILKSYGTKIFLNSVLVIGITLTVTRVLMPYFGLEGRAMNVAACAATLVVSAPFLWAIFFGAPVRVSSFRPETMDQLARLRFGIGIIRFLIGCGLAAFVVSHFMSMLAFSGILLVAMTAFSVVFFSRFSEPLYKRIEHRFVSNLTERDRADENRVKIPQLAPWNATLATFTLSPNSELVAKSLQESGIKEKFGVTVAMIERGESQIPAPTRDDLLLPFDKIYLVGTDEQLSAVQPVIEQTSVTEVVPIHNFGLAPLTLTEKSAFINKSIRECGLRETVNGLIVGIEREGRRYLSPDSSMELMPGDLVWLVGDRRVIKTL